MDIRKRALKKATVTHSKSHPIRAQWVCSTTENSATSRRACRKILMGRQICISYELPGTRWNDQDNTWGCTWPFHPQEVFGEAGWFGMWLISFCARHFWSGQRHFSCEWTCNHNVFVFFKGVGAGGTCAFLQREELVPFAGCCCCRFVGGEG